MSTAVTLRDREEWLEALLDTIDMATTDEDRNAILQEIAGAISEAIEKRDRVFGFIQHCDFKMDAVKREIERLQALKKSYEVAQSRIAEYAVSTIIGLGADAKGKYKKLEGSHCVLGVAKKPDSLSLTDPDSVPDEFKSVTVQMSAATREEITDHLPMELRAELASRLACRDISIDKNAVKAALKTNREIPGACLAPTSYRLDIK
jgi:hypothetical protein